MCKRLLRILSLVVVIATLFSFVSSVYALNYCPCATGTTTYHVTTYGNKLFGKTSKITIKNISDEPVICTVPTKISGCTASRGAGFGFGKTCTIYPGASASFVIRTKYKKSGSLQFTLKDTLGGRYTVDISGTNYKTLDQIS